MAKRLIPVCRLYENLVHNRVTVKQRLKKAGISRNDQSTKHDGAELKN